MEALLKGLKNRHEKTGDVPVLIHTVRPGLALFIKQDTDIHIYSPVAPS